MNDLIQILLKAEIDASSIKNIQEQITKISNSVQSIKINISVDDSALKSIENINKVLSSIGEKASANNGFKNIVNDVSMANKSLSDFKITNTKTFEDASGNVKKYAETVKQAGVSITQTYADIEKTKKINTVIDDKSQEARLKQEIRDAKELQRVIDQMANAREKSNQVRERESRLIEQNQAKAINKNLESNYNEIQNNIKNNELIKERIALFQREKEIKIQNLQHRYGDLLNPNAIAQYKEQLNQFVTEMSNLGDKTTPNVTNRLREFNVDLSQIESNARNSRQALDLTNKSAMSFGEAMKTAATKFLIWSTVTSTYFATIREIRSSIKYMTEMDSALTEIAMVTNQNRSQVAGLAQEYNNLAKQLKVTTSDVTAGAVEFYRQGLSQSEVFEKLQNNIKYAKIANVDYKDSAEILTATVNSMGVSIERASDVFIKLGDSTATSAGEIGTAFSKTGGSAAALGVEFEKVASWIAVISAKTRESSESIGHSINTILSRMSRITSTGFNEEDDTKLNDVAKALDTIGVKLTDSSGSFRDFGTVMDEIGSKWDKLDDKTRAYIANTVAGTRQQSRFYNLMSGYTDSIRLYEEALDSAGTTQDKFNIYLESNKATLDNLKSTAQGFWLNFWDNESLMNIVKGFTHFVQTLDNLTQKIGSVGTVFSLLIPIVGVKFLFAVKSAYIELMKMQGGFAGAGVTTFSAQLSLATKQALGLSTANEAVYLSTKKITLATTVATAGISLLVAGLFAWVNHASNAKQKMDEMVEAFSKQKEIANSMDGLIDSYKELSEKTELTSDEQQKLLDVKNKITDLIPKTKSVIDNENLSLEEQLKLLKNLNEQELQRARNEAGKTVAKYGSSYEESQDIIENATKTIQKHQKVIDELNIKQAKGIELTKEEVIAYQNSESIIAGQNKVISLHQSKIESVDAAREILNKTTREGIENIKTETGIVDELVSSQEALINSTSIIEGGFKDLIDVMKDLEEIQDRVSSGYSYSYEEIEKIREKYPELEDAIYRTAKGWSIEQSAIENLRQAQLDQRKTQIQAQLDMSKSALEQSKARISNIVKEIESIKNLADAYRLAAQLGKEMGVSQAESSIVGLVGGTNTYEEYLKSKGVNLSTAITGKNLPYGILTKEQYNSLKKQQKEVVEYGKQLDEYNKLAEETQRKLNDLTSGRISGGAKEKDKKKEYQALADATLKWKNAIEEVNHQLSILKSKQNLETDDLNKITLLQKQNELLKEQQVNYHNLANAHRAERDALAQSLAKQGFKFDGTGDNKIITNLENIKGKSKEVEEQFKKFIDLQTKEIPSAQQQWWSLQDTIENINIEKLQLEFKIADDRVKSLANSLSKLEYEFKLIEDTDLEGKAENIYEQISILENQVEEARKELELLNSVGYEEGSKSAELYAQRQEELTKRIQDGTLAIKNQEKALFDLREKARTDWIAEQNKLYDEQQKRLSELERIQERIVQIVRKRGEEEKKALDEAHKAELNSLEERHKERKKKYQEDLDGFKKLIQDKIDALDEQYQEEDYQEQLNKEREEANRLQREIDVLSLDDSLTARNKTVELRKQLADQNEKIAKMQQKRERDLLKKSLQDQLKDKEQDAKDREDIADKTYENERKRLEEDYRINKEFLDKKYSDEQVYAEARESIMRGQVEVAEGVFMDIYDAFADFENKFGKGMGILGDIIKNDFVKQLELAQEAIREMDYLAENQRRKYDSNYNPADDEIGWKDPIVNNSNQKSNISNNNSETKEIVRAKESIARLQRAYMEEIKKSKPDENLLTEYNRLAEDIRKKYNLPYEDLRGSYANGGKITKTGILTAEVHGTQSDPEWFLNDDQLQRMLENTVVRTMSFLKTPKIPSVETRQGSVYHIDKIFDISGTVTKDTMPLIRKEANGIEETLKNLNKSGVFRPVKI